MDLCPDRQKKRRAVTGILDQILTRASRRHLANVALDYFALAAGAGALGAILLLLLGTQILNWYWPVLLFLGGAAAGAWKLRQCALSRYSVAQMLDERLGLADRLSTLVWFREHTPPSAEALATVGQQATGRVQERDVARAIPFRMPRYGYASLALILSAAGLFGVRYFVLHTLDLGEPLARLDFSFFTPEPRVQAATKKSVIQERFEKQLQELGLDAEDMQAPEDDALQPVSAEVPGAAGADAPKPDAKGQQSGEVPEENEGAEDQQGTGEQQDAANGDSADQQSRQGKEGKPQGNPPQNAKQGQQGSNDSLMNKMRDALANLMNKLKNQGSDQGQQQMAMNQQQSGKQGPQSQQGMQSKAQGQGQQAQNQPGDQESGENASGDRSKAGEKNADKPGSESSKSGMGHSDGDKAIKDAEQLAAMGKISEILGKRAQQITGEITVEVASGKQNLKTAWSERKALHADTGGEVNRDEIPLAYQSYIQRYFEEIRKTTPKPAATKSGSD